MNGRKILRTELPKIRTSLLDAQGWLCPLCQRDMRMVAPRQRCVDHDHSLTGPSAGAIRGVLCSNCNGNEGRIKRRVLCSQGNLTSIEWLENLLDYWKTHRINKTGLIHHTYKTTEERRLKRNADARRRRAAKKRKGK
jgi:hypothetical protein